MRLERLHIWVLVVVAAGLWWVVLLLQGTPVSWAHARPFGAVVSSMVGLAFLFDRVLWRWPLLHGWFFKCPDLRGTWRVRLQSSYVDPQTNAQQPASLCFMGVKQTLSTLQMHLMTPESESWLITDRIRPSPSGDGYQVIGVYTNHPRIHLRDARISEMHQGALIAETHGPGLRPTTLTAVYWSDRKTVGTMDFTARLDTVFTRFDEAHAAFAAGEPSVAGAGQDGGAGGNV